LSEEAAASWTTSWCSSAKIADPRWYSRSINRDDPAMTRIALNHEIDEDAFAAQVEQVCQVHGIASGDALMIEAALAIAISAAVTMALIFLLVWLLGR
jgi:hypothetical protein